MRTSHHDALFLQLAGRRTDGEEGEQGLWLLWLVAAVFVGAGGAFYRYSPDGAMRTPGALFFWLGVLLFGYSVNRFLRREVLTLDLSQASGSYSTRYWPGPAREQYCFAFHDVKRIEIRFRIESPAQGHRGPSQAYPTWEAMAVIKPRRRLSLERNKDEDLVRKLAWVVSQAVGTELVDRSPKR